MKQANNSTCQNSMFAKSRKQDSVDLDKIVLYSLHNKQQECLHGCAGSAVPKPPVLKSFCPKGMMQWIKPGDCGATQETRTQGSARFIVSSKETGLLPPGSKQAQGSQAAVAMTDLGAMLLATEMARGQKMVRLCSWHTR